MVSVRKVPWWTTPVAVVNGEGQGALIRVEMSGPELCQKNKRRALLASASADVRVKITRRDGDEDGPGDQRTPRQNNSHHTITNSDVGIVNRAGVTIKSFGGEDRRSSAPPPRPAPPQEDLLQARRGLSDLEIGMYALLGVFCLAILVFLINCVSYTLQYRHKQLPSECQEAVPHSHHWVWLGHEGELCLNRDDTGTTADAGAALEEEASTLLNGVSAQPGYREHKGDSPTTKRKRVKFHTFGSAKAGGGCPGNDIQWVCPDIELGDSIELRNYMERLNENAGKGAA